MIIEFIFENYTSFKEEAKLSMVAAKSFKEHLEENTIALEPGLRILKSAVLYGNNASGKSNLLNAIFYMRRLVLGSLRDSLLPSGEHINALEKFQLDVQSLKETSLFEMTFVHQGIRYRYGFEVDYDRVVKEWLFHTVTKEVYLFKREGQTFEINKSSFKEGLDLHKHTRPNVLFLTLLAQMNAPVSGTLVSWFESLGVVSGISDFGHQRHTIAKLKADPKFKSWVSRFLSFLEISGISTEEAQLSELDPQLMRKALKDDELVGFITGIQDKLKARNPNRDRVMVWHKQYDGKGLLVDSVPFDLERQESEGTKKLIYLLGPCYDALTQGTVLIVDELDARLHSNLVLRLLEFFHKENETAAQLIFAGHDVSILDKDIFRRDQIYFVEKDQFGASTLYSLGDFKSAHVRNKTAFAKNYLDGKYGAIPYFELDAKLNALLHEQKA
jgi:AAA15 family ATPase/GTPase